MRIEKLQGDLILDNDGVCHGYAEVTIPELKQKLNEVIEQLNSEPAKSYGPNKYFQISNIDDACRALLSQFPETILAGQYFIFDYQGKYRFKIERLKNDQTSA